MSDPFREILEAERFENRLKKLQELTPKEKRKKAREIDIRERTRAKDSEMRNRDIEEMRNFEEELKNDENYTAGTQL